MTNEEENAESVIQYKNGFLSVLLSFYVLLRYVFKFSDLTDTIFFVPNGYHELEKTE